MEKRESVQGQLESSLCLQWKYQMEGMSSTGSPVVYFEGEKDHLLPIHNQMPQQMGTYICIGKIIGHSILHGGPGLFGLS